jgi:hypothetical protein
MPGASKKRLHSGCFRLSKQHWPNCPANPARDDLGLVLAKGVDGVMRVRADLQAVFRAACCSRACLGSRALGHGLEQSDRGRWLGKPIDEKSADETECPLDFV